jgi:hypothetical protein
MQRDQDRRGALVHARERKREREEREGERE